MSTVGAGGMFAPGVETKWKRENWKKSVVTQDRERHARNSGLVQEDERLQLAGPSIGWVAAAAEATEAFTQPRAFAHVKIPVLVFTAGKEVLVDNKQTAVVAKSIPGAEVVNIPGAKHEILMELDQHREQFWATFDRFTDHVAPQAAA